MRWRLAVLAAFGLTAHGSLSPGDAIADPAGHSDAVDINVYAPLGCSGTATLRERLAALVASPLAPARVVVTIENTTDPARLSLEVQVLDAMGGLPAPRTLSGSSCDELLSSAALILSIALLTRDELTDPTTAQGGNNIGANDANDANNANNANDANDANDELAVESLALSSRAGSKSERIAGRIGVLTALDAGTLPDAAPGAGLILGLRDRILRVELGAAYFPKRRAIADAVRVSGGDIASFTVGARACFGPVRIAVCGGGEWALLSATGFGTDQRTTTTHFLWGLTTAARSEFRVGERVVFAIAGELIGHPRRPEFRITNPDRIVHRPGWLSARGWLYGEVDLF